MKKLILQTLALIFFSQTVFSQSDFEIIKTDINSYPEMKIFVTTKGQLSSKEDFSVSCNNEELDFNFKKYSDKIAFNDKHIFFLIDFDIISKKENKESMLKLISELNSKDKINIAYFKKTTNNKFILKFSSAEFSSNHSYFIDFIQNTNHIDENNNSNIFSDLIFDVNKLIFTSEKKLNNASLIILSKSYDFTLIDVIVSKKINMYNIPFYFALNDENRDTVNDKSIIELCKVSGGMFTKTNEITFLKDVKTFLEDISATLNPDNNTIYLITVLKSIISYDYLTIRYKNSYLNVYTETPNTNKKSIIAKYNYPIVIIITSLLLLGILILSNKSIKLKKQLRFFVKETIESNESGKFIKPAGELILQTKGIKKTFIIRKKENILGRNSECDFEIPDSTVSGFHAEIKLEDDLVYIKDLSSTNGTFVNGEKIEIKSLKNKDKIKLGCAFIIFNQE